MVTMNALFKATSTFASSLVDGVVKAAQDAKVARDAQAAIDDAAAQQAVAEKEAAEYAKAKAMVADYEARIAAEEAANKAARIAALNEQIVGWNESIIRMTDEYERASAYDEMLHAKMRAIREEGEKVSDSLFNSWIKACDDRSAIYEARESARERVKALQKELAALENS